MAPGAGAAPAITTTYSPRGSTSLARATAAASVPLQVSSCSLVSSRHRATARSPPIAAARSLSVRASRWGASKSTAVRCSLARAARRAVRPEPRRGKKPSKTKRSVGRPLATRPASAAEGPGTTTTSKPPSAAARTSRSPGSDTPGRPASDTSATRAPSANRSTTVDTWDASACSWAASIGGEATPAAERRRRVWRVSSHTTRSASARVRRARGDRSSRLPMGVATMARLPRRCPPPLTAGSPGGHRPAGATGRRCRPRPR